MPIMVAAAGLLCGQWTLWTLHLLQPHTQHLDCEIYMPIMTSLPYESCRVQRLCNAWSFPMVVTAGSLYGHWPLHLSSPQPLVKPHSLPTMRASYTATQPYPWEAAQPQALTSSALSHTFDPPPSPSKLYYGTRCSCTRMCKYMVLI